MQTWMVAMRRATRLDEFRPGDGDARHQREKDSQTPRDCAIARGLGAHIVHELAGSGARRARGKRDATSDVDVEEHVRYRWGRAIFQFLRIRLGRGGVVGMIATKGRAKSLEGPGPMRAAAAAGPPSHRAAVSALARRPRCPPAVPSVLPVIPSDHTAASQTYAESRHGPVADTRLIINIAPCVSLRLAIACPLSLVPLPASSANSYMMAIGVRGRRRVTVCICVAILLHCAAHRRAPLLAALQIAGTEAVSGLHASSSSSTPSQLSCRELAGEDQGGHRAARAHGHCRKILRRAEAPPPSPTTVLRNVRRIPQSQPATVKISASLQFRRVGGALQRLAGFPSMFPSTAMPTEAKTKANDQRRSHRAASDRMLTAVVPPSTHSDSF
ncbi:hypothetical protein FA95DRAFT_411602 [Auriscalpium vulgare]|uniref:Uncharacterized protein n=1 Tax=Auriscalpium vulgare TaxID=40419 RepID=A0ACB8RI27_9AGAM|nr:hypothetical protein FA95DRAFT_411602 [Auriscalpium vulgare]